MPEYFDFEKELSTMPVDIQNQIKSIRKLFPNVSSTFVGQVYAKYLNRNCPESVQDNGHYNEIGHKFWAENVLIPYIKEQLTSYLFGTIIYTLVNKQEQRWQKPLPKVASPKSK
jgi:hypothetical protein